VSLPNVAKQTVVESKTDENMITWDSTCFGKAETFSPQDDAIPEHAPQPPLTDHD
jgi:hypothetical protein